MDKLKVHIGHSRVRSRVKQGPKSLCEEDLALSTSCAVDNYFASLWTLLGPGAQW